ncbi:MAG: hypothetical protein JXA11_07855 [Phycisphaerae bacterium]|nr:hypothetical protein [Phycisphaerae bacterium]
MSDNSIHSHNEITGLVPIGDHQREESRKFQKRKKQEKDSRSEITDQAVEDLLHHPEEPDDSDAPDDAPETISPAGRQDHLDLLL